jgi:acyl-CoA synthetase (AMP-forming)/AMP-acid ligase II
VADQTNATNNYVWRGLAMFAERGDAEAIVSGDRRFTFADLRTWVLTMAATLREHGLRSGMGVAVLTTNPPEAVVLHLALHLLGCRSIWIAKAPRRHQTEFLHRARAEAFIYDPRTHSAEGREFAAAVAPLPVFCLAPGGSGPDLAAHHPTTGGPRPTESVDEPESLFQTSGTTGRPKLVHHRQALFSSLIAFADMWVSEGRPVLRHLSVGGHWHVAQQMTALMVLFMGGTMVLHDGFAAGPVLRLIERERITSTVLTPAMLYALQDDPALATADLSSLRVVTCGGSAAAPARLSEAIERLGPVLRIVYAMSESPGITELPNLTLDPGHPERLRSCGLPYGDVRVQIRDDAGAVLPPGGIGMVWVASVLVMAGYWGDPELTRQSLVDGWLRTGDIGYLDADGYLFLVDRTADMIITGQGAANVYTRPIEDALMAHPAVRSAAVIGVPDDALGEAVHAFAVRVRDSMVTAGELREHVAAALSPTWAPREVEFVDALPLTGAGKVDKAALRDRVRVPAA